MDIGVPPCLGRLVAVAEALNNSDARR